jgi:phospholipid transport system substrate-binding protein
VVARSLSLLSLKVRSVAHLTLLLAAMLMVGYPTPSHADDEQAAAFSVSIGNEVLGILSTDTLSDAEKQDKIREMFLRVVDTDWIGRFVLGATWRKLDEAAQQDYLETYRKFLVKHYTQNFADYKKGTTFKVARVRKIGADGKQYLVSMLILRKGQQPINLDYRVRQENAESFRAIDILVEGVSLLATQRSEFASVIQREGVERLISLLKKKAA